MASSSVTVTFEDSVNSNVVTLMTPAEPLPVEVKEPFSGGASTPNGGRGSQKTAQPSPVPVPATAKMGVAIRDNIILRPNVVTRHAAAELTGAVTRYRGSHPNKNNNTDDNTNNNNHATLAERFHPSGLHNLRQLGLYTNTAHVRRRQHQHQQPCGSGETFQSSTLHKLRQLGH